MIAMGHLFVPADRAVTVIFLMSSAGVLGRARRGIGGAYFQNMVVHMIAMDEVHVSVMQVIRVAVVLDCQVPAIRTVLVAMTLVHLALLLFHVRTPLFGVHVLSVPVLLILRRRKLLTTYLTPGDRQSKLRMI